MILVAATLRKRSVHLCQLAIFQNGMKMARMVPRRVDKKPAEVYLDDRLASKYWLVSFGKNK